MAAAHHGLSNLICIVDINHQQADGPTSQVMGFEPLADKWAAFGWHVQRVDGNDTAAVVDALDRADASAVAVGKPSVVLCYTRAGFGVPLLENREKAHFMRIEADEWPRCREQLTADYLGSEK